MQKTNKLFESNNSDKEKLLTDFILILYSNYSKLVLPTCMADLINCTINNYLNPRPYL